MVAVIPTQIEKCRGAMLATAIGDALGWPNEIRSKNRDKKPKLTDSFVDWIRSSSKPRWHDEKILAGEYSDDTQLTLSVARSIIVGDWEKSFAEKELPFWLSYERGGGGALLRAAKSCHQNNLQLWQTNSQKRYFNAGGNGAAMRILPHVIAESKSQDITTLMLDIIKDTLITHGHPRAFLGAMCYAYALNYLLKKDAVLEYGELIDAVINGKEYWTIQPDSNVFGYWLNIALQNRDYNFIAEWEHTTTHMIQQLKLIKGSLKKGLMLEDTKMLTELGCFGEANGAGDVAALAAIYLASKYANNPILAIKVAAFSLGSDTDTIASMTGGLVGMLNGVNWIPSEWRLVQDYNCLVTMADLLLSNNKKDAIKNVVSTTMMTDTAWETTQIGKMKLVSSNSVPNGKNGQVIIKKWQTSLGQTLYTKSFQPNSYQPQYQQYDNQISLFPKEMLHNLVETSKSNTKNQLLDSPETLENKSNHIISPQNSRRKFVLSTEDIENLIYNPQFKKSVTIGKVMKIIQFLIENDETSDTVAQKFNVDSTMVNILKELIKS